MDENTYAAARAAFHFADSRYVRATEARMAGFLREIWPDAQTLIYDGFYTDDGFRCRARCIVLADGSLVGQDQRPYELVQHGPGGPEEWGEPDDYEQWEGFVDELDGSYLDIIARLRESDARGENTLDLEAALNPPTPLYEGQPPYVVAAAIAVQVPRVPGRSHEDASALVEAAVGASVDGSQVRLLSYCWHPDPEVLFHKDGPCPDIFELLRSGQQVDAGPTADVIPLKGGE